VVATTYEAELALNGPSNMFKALGGIIFTAPLATAIPAAFTTLATSDLVQLDPLVWNRLGLITKGEGVTFSHDMSSEDEESWGYNEPTRTDITKNVTSAQFTLQETTKAALEMYDFVDLSAVTADATTGEVAYSKPITTTLSYRRMIFMAVDGAGTDRRYRFKVMPKAQVVAVNDEVWQSSAVTKYPLTIRANVDPTLGYAVRNVLAGPGQKARNTAAKFA
jgi:hypothetical protein